MLQRESTAVCRGKWSCSKPLDTSTLWASWGPHFISMWFPSSWNTSLEDPSLVSFTGSVDLKQLDNLKYVLRAGPNDNWTLLTSIQHTSPFSWPQVWSPARARPGSIHPPDPGRGGLPSPEQGDSSWFKGKQCHADAHRHHQAYRLWLCTPSQLSQPHC